MSELVWVEVPHQGRPTVSHVMNREELTRFLLDYCVDEDFNGENASAVEIEMRAGRDKYSASVWTKDEVLARIASHKTNGHSGIALLTELKKVADNEGWRVCRTLFTDTEIASNRYLWDTYVDPDGLTDDDEWEDSTISERIDTMNEIVGESPAVPWINP